MNEHIALGEDEKGNSYSLHEFNGKLRVFAVLDLSKGYKPESPVSEDEQNKILIGQPPNQRTLRQLVDQIRLNSGP